MSRHLPALVAGALLGALVGAAAMWAMGPSEPEPLVAAKERAERASGAASPDAGSAGAAGGSAPLPAPANIAPVAPERIERSADSSGAELPPELAETVGDLVRRAPRTELAHGTKAIRGTVNDTKGQPLAGVVVRAQRQGDVVPAKPSRQEIGVAAPPPPSLEAAVRRAIADYYEHGSETVETTTGADGRYALAALRPGNWSLSIWKEGFLFDSKSGRGTVEVRPDALLDWTAKKVVAQPVVVLLPDGKHAPCANVTARKQGTNDSSDSQGWFDATPTIALEPGDWELMATLGHPQQGPAWPDYFVSEWTKVKVAEASAAAAAAAAPLEIKLKATPGVRGHVRLSTGEAPPQALVKMKKLESERFEPEAVKNADDAQSDWVGDGEFVFADVKAGRYGLVVLRNWNGAVVASGEVTVAESMVETTLTIPELDVATCIVAKVRGPDGELVNDASFSWRLDREKNNVWSNDANADKREPGTWWLPLETTKQGDFDPFGAWPAGSHMYVIVGCEAFGSTMVEVWQATRTIDVKFGPPATLLVTVPGIVGSEWAGKVNLGVSRTGKGVNSGGGGGGQPSKEEGVARMGPFEAGAYKVTMWISPRSGRRWQQIEATALDVTLAPGVNEVSLSIPPLYGVKIRLPEGADGQASLEPTAAKQSRRSAWGQVEKDGAGAKLQFDDLPAGEYKVTLNGSTNPGVMIVQVPAGASAIDWAPMPVNALRVTITDANGELAALGFQDGDLVTAFDGRAISSHVDLQVMWTLARAQKSLKFTVQRGEQSVALEAETKRFINNSKAGGTFEPASR